MTANEIAAFVTNGGNVPELGDLNLQSSSRNSAIGFGAAGDYTVRVIGFTPMLDSKNQPTPVDWVYLAVKPQKGAAFITKAVGPSFMKTHLTSADATGKVRVTLEKKPKYVYDDIGERIPEGKGYKKEEREVEVYSAC